MDITRVRQEFPIVDECIYLDTASLSPLPKPAVAAATAELDERCRHGVRRFWDWLARQEEARGRLARLINATPDELAFTQNTSEGINMVAAMLDWRDGDNVVINDLEYYPNVYPWVRLGRYGVETRLVRHNNGLITIDDLKGVCTARTRLVAISQVAWVNGLSHPLAELGAFCRQKGILLCVDAIQAVGAVSVEVRRDHVDFLSCGGHKWLFAPLGTGFFYCRRELIERFEPPYVGWQSDDRSLEDQSYPFRTEFRPAPTAKRFNHGNSNMAGIMALGASLAMLETVGWDNVRGHAIALADRVIEHAQRIGWRIQSPLDPRLRSPIVNIVPPDLPAAIAALKRANIQFSARIGGLRISPAVFNTVDEVNALNAELTALSKGRTQMAVG